ncbi:hypothetical protein GCM10010145_60880 [Streptomyces ruber]|uniref:Lipoprotein n=2 Tax=Streptomyces TaxID=1883 RepID=A0A918EWQ1_9ACTN|nr:FxLYD domain-containing protein [Streptomyces ruber]GGQ83041.1 hypothetical protein GCM10010145_60880 [Streptomyces ruber]
MAGMADMASHRAHRATGAALAAVVALAAAALTGCSGEGGGAAPADPASRAASAASSLGEAVPSAASSLPSQAAEALASATAEAERKLDEIRDGVDVMNDVQLGKPVTDSDGRTSVPVTVRNTTGSRESFAVQVDFADPHGNRLDTAVVTVGDVPAGKSAEADARSTHDLAGEIRATVHRAVRY